MEQSQIPNILLLGNGINRCFDNGISWDKLLSELSDNKYTEDDIKNIGIPAALKAMLVTGGKTEEAIKNHVGSFSNSLADDQSRMINSIFEIGFDEVLTTNYTYELEAAALGVDSIGFETVKKLMDHTDEINKAEGKYLLHTYNKVSADRIWHIHGELRKPGSMILDHYKYVSLICKIKELSDKRGSSYTKDDFVCRSWVDSFILGNVYVLGFGFDFSEIDLWWLLERKKREKSAHGKVIYYAVDTEENLKNDAPKFELLRNLGVDPIPLPVNDSKNKSEWKERYCEAVSKMKSFLIKEINV